MMEYDGNINKLTSFILEELEIHKIRAKLAGSDCGKCGFDNCKEMARAIMAGEKTVDDCEDLAEDLELEFSSAGEAVQLNKFASNIIAGVISGMAKELKGISDPNSIEIKLHRRK
jgi:molybdopterin-guanine dinucleotide biosynthesis protein B